MFLLGTVFFIESLRLGLGRAGHPGAGFMPFFVGIGLCFLGFYSLIKRSLGDPKEGERVRVKFFGHSIFRVIATVIAMSAYVILLPWLGFLISSFMLLVFLFKTGGVRKWTTILGAALLTVCISYWLFSLSLNVRLPRGIWRF